MKDILAFIVISTLGSLFLKAQATERKVTKSGIVWELVKRHKAIDTFTNQERTYEVWKDLRTGILWSSRLDHPNYVWDHAKGDGDWQSRGACISTEGIRASALLKDKKFQLPWSYAFRGAEHDGIREVLDLENFTYWAYDPYSTSVSAHPYFFWALTGQVLFENTYEGGQKIPRAVICIACEEAKVPACY